MSENINTEENNSVENKIEEVVENTNVEENNSVEETSTEYNDVENTNVENEEQKKTEENESDLDNMRKVSRNNRSLRATNRQLDDKLKEYEAKLKEYEDEYIEDDESTKKEKAFTDREKKLNARYERSSQRELLNKYTDFTSVVTDDTVGQLIDTDPISADRIAKEEDIYLKGEMAYQAILKNKLYKKPAEKYTEAKINKNMVKPRHTKNTSTNSDPDALTKFLNTPDGQAQLRREYEEAKNRI